MYGEHRDMMDEIGKIEAELAKSPEMDAAIGEHVTKLRQLVQRSWNYSDGAIGGMSFDGP